MHESAAGPAAAYNPAAGQSSAKLWEDGFLKEHLGDVIDWLESHLGLSLAFVLGWVVLLVASLWAGKYFLVHIPADYFTRRHAPLEQLRSRPMLRYVLLIAKNLLGILLIVLGLVMLFTPGQGILSLIVGFALSDIPGKQHVERWILSRSSVRMFVDRLRQKEGQAPLVGNE